MCLSCGLSFCSRYVNGHMEKHWKETASTTPSAGILLDLVDLKYQSLSLEFFHTDLKVNV